MSRIIEVSFNAIVDDEFVNEFERIIDHKIESFIDLKSYPEISCIYYARTKDLGENNSIGEETAEKDKSFENPDNRNICDIEVEYTGMRDAHKFINIEKKLNRYILNKKTDIFINRNTKAHVISLSDRSNMTPVDWKNFVITMLKECTNMKYKDDDITISYNADFLDFTNYTIKNVDGNIEVSEIGWNLFKHIGKMFKS